MNTNETIKLAVKQHGKQNHVSIILTLPADYMNTIESGYYNSINLTYYFLDKPEKVYEKRYYGKKEIMSLLKGKWDIVYKSRWSEKTGHFDISFNSEPSITSFNQALQKFIASCNEDIESYNTDILNEIQKHKDIIKSLNDDINLAREKIKWAEQNG